MQSKLSKLQKDFLIELYFLNPNEEYQYFDMKGWDKSSYNVRIHSRNSLIKRGLLEKRNEGKYVKQFGLTMEGFRTVEDMLLVKTFIS